MLRFVGAMAVFGVISGGASAQSVSLTFGLFGGDHHHHPAPAPLLAAGIPAFLALGGGAAASRLMRRRRAGDPAAVQPAQADAEV